MRKMHLLARAFGVIAIAVFAAQGAWAQQATPVLLVDEHRPYDWEAISLELLVEEVETAAVAEGLEELSVDVVGNTINIIYRDLQFPADSPEITPETRDKISGLARVLERFANRNLLVEGHTAQVAGDDDDGTLLSGQRASAVADTLAATGIFSRAMIQAEGRGEFFPIADNETEEGRALNRRVEISIQDQVDAGAAAPQAVWWKQYTDTSPAGTTVFMVDSALSSVAGVRQALAQEEQESGAAIGDLVVRQTSEGIAVIYDQAEFDDQDRPTPTTRHELSRLADTLAEIDRRAQARVGGFGEDLPEEQSSERQFQTGLQIATQSEIRPSSTLVGDEPLAFSVGGVCEANPGFFHSVELSANGSFPVGRYREFSNLGIGAGARFDVRIPQVQHRPALAPIRFGLGVEGLYHFPEDTSSVTDLWEFGWMLSGGYALELGRLFILTPQIGYGGTVHVLSNTQEEDPQTFTEVNGESYYSQTLGVELDLALRPGAWVFENGSRIGVFLRPGYRVFFDEDYFGHSITAKLGGRFYF